MIPSIAPETHLKKKLIGKKITGLVFSMVGYQITELFSFYEHTMRVFSKREFLLLDGPGFSRRWRILVLF